MPLYGHELSESINPYAAGVGWAVKLDKGEFAGKSALAAYKAAPGRARIGLKLESKRIARQGAIVFSGEEQVGEVTSGTFSPTLQVSVAMALVDPATAAVGARLTVDVRGHREPAQVVKLPFYKRPRTTSRTG
jgi:aminomethyltransferase